MPTAILPHRCPPRLPLHNARTGDRAFAARSPSIVALLFLVLWSRPAMAASDDLQELSAAAARHWAFQPLQRFTPPDICEPADVTTSRSVIDQFVADGYRQARIEPCGRADSRTLVRRLYIDLIGLPPSPSQVSEFEHGNDPLAFERLVDRLLSQPEFGERWGRHWLDVARYADSNGCSIEANNTYDNAWRYRDYVIDAFNKDKPFDRFVVEQVAGDLLDWVSEQQRCEQLIATGFLQFGPKAFGTGSFEQLRLDTIDEQIDSIGKAFLGLSLGCARCHDHKLEPISTEDYYGLAGIFGSTKSVKRESGWRSSKTWNRVPLPVLDEKAADALRKLHQQRLEQAKSGQTVQRADAALRQAKDTLKQLEKEEPIRVDKVEEAKQEVAAASFELKNAQRLAKVLPVISPVPVAMAVEDAERIHDEPVRIGGDRDERGTVVPRGVPPVYYEATPDRFAVPAGQSGRRQLAEWIVDVEDGVGRLTARLIVNRVWQHLIGGPLFATPDNLGLTGATPSHPELLDTLAADFVLDGWSIKRLIRRIVLTDTYQLASIHEEAEQTAEAAALDPENRWLWRRQPRRLDVDALRDAILLIAGQLDKTRGGQTLQQQGLVTISSDMIDLKTPSPFLRRSVYLPVIRDAVGMDPQLDAITVMRESFDFACPNLVCGKRGTSTVPSQSLFLLNSPFILEHSAHLATRLLANRPQATDMERINWLFRNVLLRPTLSEESEGAMAVLETLRQARGDGSELTSWSGVCQAVLTCNEFLFVN